MKTTKRILLGLLLVISLAVLALYITGNNHIFRGLALTYLDGKKGPTIDDGLKFDRDTLAYVKAEAWPISSDYGRMKIPPVLRDSLEKYETAAFLVIDQDSLVFEEYWADYSERSFTNGFSMAKSLVGLAIGAAIDDGYIENVQVEVGSIFPHLEEGPSKKLTIEHLLQMSSGIDFGESYSSPFGFVAKAYYGYDLESLILGYEVSYEPGSIFHYQGGNTQLLAMVIEKVTGKPFIEYFNERIWSHLGAESDAWWTVDERGMVRASCCFYSNARDFARLAKLMMQNGEWNGKQIISSDYIVRSLSPVMNVNKDGDVVDYYGYQWWLADYMDSKTFAMRGLQGQYVIGVPERELIIVRLGHKRSKVRKNHMPLDMYTVLELGCIMDR